MKGTEAIDWVLAAVALASGLLLGELGGRLIRQGMRRPQRADSVRANASAAGSFVFWMATAAGLTVAVGVLDRDVIVDLGERAEADLPRLLVAAVTVIVAWGVGVAVAAAVGQSALRATGVRQPTLERVLRIGITLTGVVVALTELGVETAVLAVLVVVVAGAPALAAALLTANGGREVASQLAAGRALRPQLREGWQLRCDAPEGPVSGQIVAVHPTSVELLTGDGARRMVPHRLLLDHPFTTNP